MGVADLARQPELVVEALEGGAVGGDLRPDKLQGDLFVELFIQGAVDSPHPAMAQLLDDLVAAGKEAACCKLLASRLQGLGDQGRPLVSLRRGG
jgi:hypothetical protein